MCAARYTVVCLCVCLCRVTYNCSTSVQVNFSGFTKPHALSLLHLLTFDFELLASFLATIMSTVSLPFFHSMCNNHASRRSHTRDTVKLTVCVSVPWVCSSCIQLLMHATVAMRQKLTASIGFYNSSRFVDQQTKASLTHIEGSLQNRSQHHLHACLHKVQSLH